jgi:2,4-dienoyl-CoA reductase-like NADH-dependent reductase (Old Yellow Enzyme family)
MEPCAPFGEPLRTLPIEDIEITERKFKQRARRASKIDFDKVEKLNFL